MVIVHVKVENIVPKVAHAPWQRAEQGIGILFSGYYNLTIFLCPPPPLQCGYCPK